MGGVFSVIIVLLLIGVVFAGVGFFIWRRMLHFAKGIERGIKMVPVLIHLPPPSEDIEGGARDIREVIQERISQAEVLYNLIAGTFKKGFKSRFYGQRHLSFEIIAVDGVIKFFVAVPVALQSVIEQAILTAYPTARLEEVEDHNIFNPAGKLTGTSGGEVELKENYAYPIATFNQSKRDAITALINGLMALQKGEGGAVQILVRPAASGWTKSASHIADQKRNKKDDNKLFSMKDLARAPFKVPESKSPEAPEKPLSNLEQSIVDAIEDKTRHPGFEVNIRLIASAPNSTRAQAILGNLIASFSLYDAPGMNGFKFKPAKNPEEFVTAFIFRFFPPKQRATILNSVELATLFHFPDDQFTHTSQIQREYSKQVEAPSRLPEDGLLLGYNNYRGVKKEVRLSDEDRRRHVYIVGQTGTGKTTILKHMMVQDMLAGKGLAFLDPHGDAAEELLTLVPKSRTEDIVYFSPGDMDYPLGLNLFEFETPDQKDFLIQEAINMLYRLYDPQHQGIIGPIYEHWFRNAALAVMADPAGGTFIDIPKMFLDRTFMRDKLRHVSDPTVLDFWNKEMVQTSEARRGEILGWFVSKFGAFASNEMMRNVVGQVKSSFNLRQVMDEGKILIANLSKGRMGELNSMLLGMIFVMKFQAAAMSRANIPEAQRRDFSLYVDEFQNYSTDSFGTILAEARKYHLNLIVANQFIAQLNEDIREAVFGNVGTAISFRCGPNDAEFLVKQFSPAFDARDLVNLPNFQSAARLMVAGSPSQPFSMILPPPLHATHPKLSAALKILSAAKYARPRSEIEGEIFKRLETKPQPSPFESLGMPPAGQLGGSRLPPLPAPTTGGGSFLDEWLAKRRSQRPGISPAAGASNLSTRSDRATVKPERSVSPSNAFSNSTQVPSGDSAYVDELTKPQADRPADSDLARTIGHSPKVINPPSKDEPKLSPDQILADQAELDRKISNLQTEKSTAPAKPKAATPPIKEPNLQARPPGPPKLKPGEILIDEEGYIHRAGESALKIPPPQTSA